MAYAVKRSRGEGAAIVEMALILPLLLLLTFGVIEYGWLFLKAHETTNAARHGARIACRPDATNSQVVAEVSALMDTAGLGDSGYVVSISPADISQMSSGETLTIKVEVPYEGNVELMSFPFIPVPSFIRASTSMAKEGP